MKNSNTTGGVREVLATCVGLGYGPLMPGTFGTLPAVAVYAAVEVIRFRTALTPVVSSVILFLLAVITTALGISLGSWAEDFFGRKDPSHFVLDEVAGFFTTVCILPLCFPDKPLWLVLPVAFITARFFDIIKLPPARQCEKLQRGWGIVLDDVASGVYSALLSCVILALVPGT